MSDRTESRPPDGGIGVALGGGGSLGAAHVGALRALDERGIRPSYVAGTSVGALIGAMWIFEVPLADIEARAVEMSWFDITEFTPSRLGIFSNAKLGRMLDDELGDVKLEDAPIPFAAVATDIATGDKVVLTKGDLGTAVMASASLPGIYRPVEWDGRLLVDGGLVEPVPVATVRDLGAERVIAADLHGKRVTHEPDNVVDILENAIDIAVRSAVRLLVAKADVAIQPGLRAQRTPHPDRIPELIEEGYEAAVAALDAADL